MNDVKTVIAIISNSNNSHDITAYFTKVNVDNEGYINIEWTNDIWSATRFIFNTKDEKENKKISALVRLLKIYYGEKYTIEFKQIKIEY